MHAGYVEWGMSRALLWLRNQPPAITPDVNRLGWEALVAEINNLAKNSKDAQRVSTLLEQHGIGRLTAVRNHLVHGRWSVAMAPEVTIIRHRRKETPMIMLTRTEDVQAASRELLDLAIALETSMPLEYRRLHWPGNDDDQLQTEPPD